MSKAENTSENEEKIENQNEQNNSINIEENDSVKSENLSSIQEETESMIIDGFESVVILTPDGKEKIYKCPESENKNRKWFISYHMEVPIYTEGKSVIDSILKNAGLTYNAGKIFGENKGKLLDRFGNSIKNIYRPAPASNLLRDLLINAAKNDVYVSDKTLYSKWGDHITGKNGNLVELDNGKGKVISNVPYFSQLLAQTKDEYIDENGEYKTITGKVLCQLTAIAMLLWVKGIKGSTDKYFPDELYDFLETNGGGKGKVTDTLNNCKKIIEKIAPDFIVKDIHPSADYINKIKNQINKKNPVVISLNYKDSQNKDSGHVVFIVGYTENGFIIHDPYGNLNKGKNNHLSDDFDGSYVEYPYDKYDICNRHIYLINKK